MLFKFAVFKITAAFYKCFNFLTRLLLRSSLGEGSRELRKENEKNSQCSAQVSRVFYKSRISEYSPPSPKNFLTRHIHYENPKKILYDSSVSLFWIDSKFAYFIQVPKDVDITLSASGPFYFDNQFKYVKYLIRVPLEHWRASLPAMSKKLIIISNTGRCGSTLLSQVFEKYLGATTISEPGIFSMFRSDWKEGDKFKSEMLKDVIRTFFLTTERDTVVIKVKSHEISIVRMIAKMFPDSIHIYMFRGNPLNYVVSVRSVANSLPWVLRYFLARKKKYLEDLVSSQCSDNSALKKAFEKQFRGVKKDIGVFACLFAGNVLSAREFIKLNTGKKSLFFLSYEELINNSFQSIAAIKRHCSSDPQEETGAKPVESLPSGDSQQNSALSRQNLNKSKISLRDDEVKIIDDVLSLCGLPDSTNFPRTGSDLEKYLKAMPTRRSSLWNERLDYKSLSETIA